MTTVYLILFHLIYVISQHVMQGEPYFIDGAFELLIECFGPSQFARPVQSADLFSLSSQDGQYGSLGVLGCGLCHI